MDVSPHASWKTVKEAIEFLNMHMLATDDHQVEAVVSYALLQTVVIDLPYTLTIQGSSYGISTIAATSGLANKPMFSVSLICSFKMLQFDATTLYELRHTPWRRCHKADR
jgi:hypothetical protein